MKYRGVHQTSDMIEAHRDANAALWTSCSHQRTVAETNQLSRSQTLKQVTVISGVDPPETELSAGGSKPNEVGFPSHQMPPRRVERHDERAPRGAHS